MSLSRAAATGRSRAVERERHTATVLAHVLPHRGSDVVLSHGIWNVSETWIVVGRVENRGVGSHVAGTLILSNAPGRDCYCVAMLVAAG